MIFKPTLGGKPVSIDNLEHLHTARRLRQLADRVMLQQVPLDEIMKETERIVKLAGEANG